jgi:hypothetical protein
MHRPRKPPATLEPSEAELLAATLDYLKLKGVYCWRQNTGAVKATYGGRSRFIRFGIPGQCDITGILGRAHDNWGPTSLVGVPNHRGTRLEIELKRKGRRPTEKQLAFMRAINYSGGVAFWCDSLGRLVEIMDAVLSGARTRLDIDGDVVIYRDH